MGYFLEGKDTGITQEQFDREQAESVSDTRIRLGQIEERRQSESSTTDFERAPRESQRYIIRVWSGGQVVQIFTAKNHHSGSPPFMKDGGLYFLDAKSGIELYAVGTVTVEPKLV
jgi:hypothetical protein